MVGLLNSCTIEKRKYLDGYHVEWNGKAKSTQTTATTEPDAEVQLNPPVEFNSTTDQATNESNAQTFSDQKNVAAVQEETTAALAENVEAQSNEKKPAKNLIKAKAAKKVKAIYESKISSFLPNVENEGSEAGTILAKIAFGLLLLTLIIGIIASLVVEGWTALGYFIIAMLTFGLAALFAIIAKVVLDANDQETPWYLWTTLIAALLAGIWILIKLIS